MNRKLPAPGSTAAAYLALVREVGPCQCPIGVCMDDDCPVCGVLDVEWPCPNDQDSDYPSSDLPETCTPERHVNPHRGCLLR